MSRRRGRGRSERDTISETAKSIIDEERVEEKRRAADELWRHLRPAIESRHVLKTANRLARIIGAKSRVNIAWPQRLAEVLRGGVFHAGRFRALTAARVAIDWISTKHRPPYKIDEEEDFLEYGRRVIPALVRVSKIVHKYNASVEVLEEVIDPERVATTPIAYKILALLARIARTDADNYALVSSGERMLVAGKLGTGKTTLVILSTYMLLRYLGVPRGPALRYLRRFVVNNLTDYIEAIYVASTHAVDEGMILPVIALDDAAVLLSKYAAWSRTASKEELQIARAITEQLQISREGIGLLIFNTSRVDMLARGLRDTLDEALVSIELKDNYGVYTAWLTSTDTVMVSSVFDAWVRGKVRRLVRFLRFGVIRSDIAGTATWSPPIYTMRELYQELQAEKVTIRRLRSELLAEQIEGREEHITPADLEEKLAREEAEDYDRI